jgi:hypothetical protein
MGPFIDGDKCFIPINLFIAALNMDIEMNSNMKSILVQYRMTFL